MTLFRGSPRGSLRGSLRGSPQRGARAKQFALFLVVASGLLGSSASANLCLKANYRRSSGHPPTSCHGERIGETCFRDCQPGFDADGPVCRRVCPSGATLTADNRGCMFRGREAAADRTACAAGVDPTKAQGCAKCPDGLAFSAGVCRVLPRVMAREAYQRKSRTLACTAGLDFDGGLCYAKCESGFLGMAHLCVTLCPREFSADCGPACGSEAAACQRDTPTALLQKAVGGDLPKKATLDADVVFPTEKPSREAAAALANEIAVKLARRVAERKALSSRLLRVAGRRLRRGELEAATGILREAATLSQVDVGALSDEALRALLASVSYPTCKGDVANPPNVALRKRASLSSLEKSFVADFAVDGDRGVGASGEAVAKTSDEVAPYFEVDLGRRYDLHEVRIFLPPGVQLAGFEVLTSPVPFPPGRAAAIGTKGVGHFEHKARITGEGKVAIKGHARYVRVQRKDKGALRLAEVEVMGAPR